MNKRKLLSDYYGIAKKPKNLNSNCSKENEENSNIDSALQELKKTFKFNENIPPIVLVHQFYSIIKCRTTVDKKINQLQSEGVVRLIKFGIDECSLGVVLTEDLIEFLSKKYPSNRSIKKFLTSVIPEVRDVSVEKSLLKQKLNLTDHDIGEFVNSGLLTVRSASSYWFSIPSIGEFIKVFVKGRKALLRNIRQCKYNEILLTELEKRVLKKSMVLPMQYHIHDVIGAELVKCVETTSGVALRFLKMPSTAKKKA